MIFVTLGTQKFQFNRLLKIIDRLIEEGVITERVFAQTGYSDYQPRNFNYENFLSRDDFLRYMVECNKVITHGGTGAIIAALKYEKKVIAMARKAEFGEHVDDHQVQIVEQFNEINLLLGASSYEEMKKSLREISFVDFRKYQSNTKVILNSLENFIINDNRFDRRMYDTDYFDYR